MIVLIVKHKSLKRKKISVDLPFIERMKNKYGVETIYKIKNIQHARK